MKTPNPEQWFVVVNPSSGGRRAQRLWPKIKSELEHRGIVFEFSKTEYPGHALSIVGAAIDKGFRTIIAVGGDGTLHETVNAIMGHPSADRSHCLVGLIPVGTGNDWARQYGIPRKYKEAIDRILRNRIITQDIGVLELSGESPKMLYFNNLAGAGFDGFVVEKIHRFKHLGALAYLAGAVWSLVSYNNFRATIRVEAETYSGDVFMLVAGIGRFSGGGMQLTSSPVPDDGKLDISLVPAISRLGVLGLMPKLFNGKAGSDRRVMSSKSTSLAVAVEGNAPFIQADGELVGKGSFRINIIPSALNFYI